MGGSRRPFGTRGSGCVLALFLLRGSLTDAVEQSNIPFMDIKESDITLSVQVNIVAATAFSQESIAMFTAPAYVPSPLPRPH